MPKAKRALARAIASHPQESRREWLLGLFAAEAATSAKNEKYQIWQEGYHPIELNDAEKTAQRLKYLHENPVREGWVWQPQDYLYSSAAVYYTGAVDERVPLAML